MDPENETADVDTESETVDVDTESETDEMNDVEVTYDEQVGYCRRENDGS